MSNDEPQIIQTHDDRVSCVIGTPGQFLNRNQRLHSELPDDPLQKVFLSVSLYGAGRYSEAANLASEFTTGAEAQPKHYEFASQSESLQEIILSLKNRVNFSEGKLRAMRGRVGQRS